MPKVSLSNLSYNDIINTPIFLKRIFKFSISKQVYFFPTVFHIQTIDVCNGSCKMCPNAYNKDKIPNVMSNQLFEKIINEIVQENNVYTYVYLYLQNEPLMDKNIFKKLRFIKNVSNKRLKTGIITNGLLLIEDKIQELIKSEVDEIVVSIDAHNEETYNKIRQGLNFQTIIRNVENILDSNYKKHISVGFVKQKENISEFSDFKKFWKKKGASIFPSKIVNRSGGLPDFQNFCLEKKDISILERLNDYFWKKLIKCCPLVLTTFNILSNGDVILCCNDYSRQIILGNVKDTPIKEVWYNVTYQKIRKTLYNKDLRKIPPCRDCSVWYLKNVY